MSGILNIRKEDNSWAGLIISVFMHLLLIIGSGMFFNLAPVSSGGGGGYVEVTTDDGVSNGALQKNIEQVKVEQTPVKETVSDELIEKVASKEKVVVQEKTTTAPVQTNNNPAPGKTNTPGRGKYMGYSTGVGDTSGLQQIYSEKSLNVRINYPSGWTFVDQNKRSKLDGVTFWADNGIFDPPPYVFLEVKEKYLFNPARFKYSTQMRNAVIYYNDPEELENQVSQIFYFRTEGNDDFSLKLIMNGRESFKAFQPVFFGMIKTFKFGKSWF